MRKKRQYRKRKQAQQQQQNQIIQHTAVHHFQNQQHSSGDIDIMDSSDEDMLSPVCYISNYFFLFGTYILGQHISFLNLTFNYSGFVAV